jgi:hypothetical protein
MDRYRIHGPFGSVVVEAWSLAEAEAKAPEVLAEQQRQWEAKMEARAEAKRRALFGSFDADGRPVEGA